MVKFLYYVPAWELTGHVFPRYNSPPSCRWPPSKPIPLDFHWLDRRKWAEPAAHILPHPTKGNDGRRTLPPIEVERFHGVLDVEIEAGSLDPL